MSSYFISPEIETGLEVQPRLLKEALALRWPNLSIQDVNEGNRLFSWEIPKMKFAALEGYLDATRQVLILDGDIHDCAEFAVWYRQLIKETCPLVFYDEGYTGSVTLGLDISVNEIIARFMGSGESQQPRVGGEC